MSELVDGLVNIIRPYFERHVCISFSYNNNLCIVTYVDIQFFVCTYGGRYECMRMFLIQLKRED